jgi:hypothetical protein
LFCQIEKDWRHLFSSGAVVAVVAVVVVAVAVVVAVVVQTPHHLRLCVFSLWQYDNSFSSYLMLTCQRYESGDVKKGATKFQGGGQKFSHARPSQVVSVIFHSFNFMQTTSQSQC